jgi:hypothetical protein
MREDTTGMTRKTSFESEKVSATWAVDKDEAAFVESGRTNLVRKCSKKVKMSLKIYEFSRGAVQHLQVLLTFKLSTSRKGRTKVKIVPRREQTRAFASKH